MSECLTAVGHTIVVLDCTSGPCARYSDIFKWWVGKINACVLDVNGVDVKFRLMMNLGPGG